MKKTLIVLERSNGWYGGYEKRGNSITQVFNTYAQSLFSDIKGYTDKGYSVVCIDKSHEHEFMQGRATFEEFLANQSIVW